MSLIAVFDCVDPLPKQDGQTALDVGSTADDVKEALLAYRFSAEEVEDEFLQERIPALVERVIVSAMQKSADSAMRNADSAKK